MSRTILLQGEPGSGKSMMTGLTAVNKPVHFIDIDRKIASAGWATDAITRGEITFQELTEPFDDQNFRSRVQQLATGFTNKGPEMPPQGWIKFAEMIYDLPKKAANASTWAVDSLTLGNEHLKTFIMFHAKRSKYTFDQWNALKIGWMDTFSVMRDLAKENNKDLIVTVHERFKEEPGDRTTGVSLTPIKQGDDVVLQKTYQGTQDVKVWASIDGAFGDLIGAQVDEYYYLYVKTDNNGNPMWRCRVQPDGRRNLRTSFANRAIEYNPDFREIWR